MVSASRGVSTDRRGRCERLFPTAAVYSDTTDPELRLITCGGTLDRSAHNYLGQTIVYATKV